MNEENHHAEPNPRIETLEAELAKLKRRQDRNTRAAQAKRMMQGILSMLTPKDLVLDCGANIGDVTEVLTQTWGVSARVRASPLLFRKTNRTI